MHRLFRFFLLAGFSISAAQAQVVLDIFRKLPKDSGHYPCQNIDTDLLISRYREGLREYSNEVYCRLETVDAANGYLNLYGAFEGRWELCYWNLEDSARLVAVYAESCGPGCRMEELSFYRYAHNQLTPLKTEDIVPDVYPLFCRKDKKAICDRKQLEGYFPAILFHLPQKGTSLVAYIGNEDMYAVDEWKELLNGNYLELSWNNGIFTAGKPCWK